PGTYDVVANGQSQKVTVTVASTATLNFAGAASMHPGYDRSHQPGHCQRRADGSYSLMGLDPGTYDVVANGQSQKVTVTVAS
ncbi:hypothetical protein C7E17_25670, partial [Stenotrophomonas maltophilia]